jgi:outer membrane protein
MSFTTRSFNTMSFNKRRIFFTLLLSLVLCQSFGTAQEAGEAPVLSPSSQNLATFLEAVKTNPAMLANQNLVEVAQAQLAAVYSPVSATVQGSYTTGSYSFPDDVPQEVRDNIPTQTGSFSVGATLRPFVFGDLADLAEQRRIAVEQAKLTYQQTLADLEAQAIEAAANLQLAQLSLGLAQTGQDVAEAALESTQIRFERGAASEAEVRAAQERVNSADNQLQNAEAGVALAQQGLNLLVGDATLETLPTLAPAQGTPPDVRQAEFNVALATIGIGSSNRAFVPTVQASLAIPLDDSKSEVNFSLESRTLQPTVTYKYDNPKQTVGQGVPVPRVEGFPDLGVDDVNYAFSVGVSATISAEQFNNVDAANKQLAAAQAGLTGAQDRAALTALTLSNSYQTAVRGLQLAQLTLSNAESTLTETKAREEAGLTIGLEVDQATLLVGQAELGVVSAEIETLKAILSTYKTYALPVSETLAQQPQSLEESQ